MKREEIRTIEDLKTEEITYKGYDVKTSEDNDYWYVDFRTGAGEALYPKTDWTLEEALEDQYRLDQE